MTAITLPHEKLRTIVKFWFFEYSGTSYNDFNFIILHLASEIEQINPRPQITTHYPQGEKCLLQKLVLFVSFKHIFLLNSKLIKWYHAYLKLLGLVYQLWQSIDLRKCKFR